MLRSIPANLLNPASRTAADGAARQGCAMARAGDHENDAAGNIGREGAVAPGPWPPGFAPAKVNLTLHILGRRGDGYHSLESLVAFADVGDRLARVVGEAPAISVFGPFAAETPANADNLVLRAAAAFSARFGGAAHAFSLEKHLPVASGIGGGSADAAAALRLCAADRGWDPIGEEVLSLAASLGADVPVCIERRARMMRGTGAVLDPPCAFPAVPAVLVNPRVPVPTGAVFAALGLAPGQGMDHGTGHPLCPPAAVADVARFIDWLSGQRNDLEPPALRVAPVVAEVLGALRRDGACRLARMSGSGGTCFGLYESHAAAKNAAVRLIAQNPGWWVAATILA